MKRIFLFVSIIFSIIIFYIGYKFISIQLHTVTANKLYEKVKETDIPLFVPIEEVNEALSKEEHNHLSTIEEKNLVRFVIENYNQLYDLDENQEVIALLISTKLIGNLYIKESTPFSELTTIFHENNADALDYEQYFLEKTPQIEDLEEVTILDEPVKMFQSYGEQAAILTNDHVSHIYKYFDLNTSDLSKLHEKFSSKGNRDFTNDYFSIDLTNVTFPTHLRHYYAFDMFRYEIGSDFEAASFHYYLQHVNDEYERMFGNMRMDYHIGETIDDILYYRFKHSSIVEDIKETKHDYVRLISEDGIKVERHRLENRQLFIWDSNETTNMFEFFYNNNDDDKNDEIFQQEIQAQLDYFMLEVIDSIEKDNF